MNLRPIILRCARYEPTTSYHRTPYRLRPSYAVSGTDLEQQGVILSPRYAVSGNDMGYYAIRVCGWDWDAEWRGEEEEKARR
eukprot:2318273-Rhodomonas_salina.1